MRLYTRRGDLGSTDVGVAKRVKKDDALVEVLGTVDELNACLGEGVALAEEAQYEDWVVMITTVQHDLFDLGGQLANASLQNLQSSQIDRLERWIDDLVEKTPALRFFILPGGSLLSASLHRSRTVARRLERRMVSWLPEAREDGKILSAYINRISDWLFALARAANCRVGREDVLYRKDQHVRK